MSFKTITMRFGRRRVLVARPNGRQYGHLGLEIVMSLASARKDGADVYLVRSDTPLGGGLFELESPDVRVLRPTPIVRELFRTCISLRKFRERVDDWRDEFREHVEQEFVREATRYVTDPGMPQEIRERLRGVRGRLRASLERAMRDKKRRPTYYMRRLLREPVPVHLHPAANEDAVRQAIAHGIAPDAKLVCIHAREAGYKSGAEIQDTKPDDGRDDTARNARIESYLEAADELVRRGYTVIRLGDPSMTPVNRPGVVDLATSPARTNLLEVHCLLHCDFIIAGESAYVNLVYLTNTPILLVNATEPISAYPIRGPGLFLPKTVVDKRDGRRLSNVDLVSFEYHRQLRDRRRYLYVDNTPEEIRTATEEMLDWVDGRWTESPGQRTYHDVIMAATKALWPRSGYVRKWGLDEGFLGDGRIAKVALATQ